MIKVFDGSDFGKEASRQLAALRQGYVVRGILVSAPSISPLHKNCNMLDAVVRWQGLSFPCSALIDSGAEGNFIDESWAIEHGIPLHKLPDPPTAFDGRVLSNIHRATVAVSLSISGNHQETFFFFFCHSPLAPIVLGHPLLVQHNRQINWVEGSILSWSLLCHAKCLVSAVPAVSSSLFFQEESIDLLKVLEEYHDMRAVFSRSRATSLPPH